MSDSPLLFSYIPLNHLKIYPNYRIILLCIIVYLKLKGLWLWQLQGEFKQKAKVYSTEDPNYSSDQLCTDFIQTSRTTIDLKMSTFYLHSQFPISKKDQICPVCNNIYGDRCWQNVSKIRLLSNRVKLLFKRIRSLNAIRSCAAYHQHSISKLVRQCHLAI